MSFVAPSYPLDGVIVFRLLKTASFSLAGSFSIATSSQPSGDSLGATLEFLSWEHIQETYPLGLRNIVGGGHFGWPAGHATDDTDLTRAVLLAYRDTITGRGRPGSAGVVKLSAHNMVDWYDGRWPDREKGVQPMDVGGATMTGIRRFKASNDEKSCGAGDGKAGNGSLMRCIPTALFVGDRLRLITESMAISAITHDDAHATTACAAYNGMVRALIDGKGVDAALADAKEVIEACANEASSPKVALAAKRVQQAINSGVHLITVKELAEKGPKEAENATKVIPFKASGYVLDSLTIAVAAMMDSRSFEDVLVDVVRIGKDTDTNAAIAGGLLGARDGVEAIPLRWREKLQFGKEFEGVVDEILAYESSV